MESTEDGDDIGWDEEFTPQSDSAGNPDGERSGAGETGADPGKVKGHVSRMELNTNKAGMDGLDKERINKIIMEASLGSKFYENERKKDRQVNQRIEKLLTLRAKVTPSQLRAAQIKVDELVKELERGRDLSRTIIHIDMDMFYAAVEMLEKPELREKPMAVGGKHMLSTSNYVARQFGVRAGMPGFIGLKLCPDLVLVPVNFDKYRKYSKQVQAVLAEYDPNFSQMSLDEAYLDFTDHMVWRQTTMDRERTFCGGLGTDPCESAETDTDVSILCSPKCCECYKVEDKGENKISETNKSIETDSHHSVDEAGMHSTRDVEIQRDDELNDCSLMESSVSDLGVLNNGEHQDYSVEEREANPLKSRTSQPIVFGTSVEEAVREMRFRIQQRTKLTASAGIAPNCMLAKIASDMNKPNGQYIIKSTREEVMKFILDLPVRKISGIGKVMEKVLAAVGVKTCTDLYQQRALLYKIFPPISFNHFIRISVGLGSTCVGREEQRKSISTERTFREKSNPEVLMQICQGLCESLAKDAETHGLKGRTLTLKTKTVGFEVKNRSYSSVSGIGSYGEISKFATDLLRAEIRAAQPKGLSLRLMGIRLSAFLSEDEIQDKQKQVTLMSFIRKSSAVKKQTDDSGPVVCRSQFERSVGEESLDLLLNEGPTSWEEGTRKPCGIPIQFQSVRNESKKTELPESSDDEQKSPRLIDGTETQSGANIPSTSGGCDAEIITDSSVDSGKVSDHKLCYDGGHDSAPTGVVSNMDGPPGKPGGLHTSGRLPGREMVDTRPVPSGTSRIGSIKPSGRRRRQSSSKDKQISGDILKFFSPGCNSEPRVEEVKSTNHRQCVSGCGVSKMALHQGVPECGKRDASTTDRSGPPIFDSGMTTFKASRTSFFGGILSRRTGGVADPSATPLVSDIEDSGDHSAGTERTDPEYGVSNLPDAPAVTSATSQLDMLGTSPRNIPDCDLGKNLASDFSTNEEGSRSDADEHRYLCPVCNREWTYASLDEFNRHVDLCLNRGAISSMLKDQDPVPRTASAGPTASTSLKRQYIPTSPKRKPRKKAKITTLDRFFSKNS